LKLVSETFVVLNEDVEIDMQALSDDEYLLIEALDMKRSSKKVDEAAQSNEDID
jgi:hypothetical protein